MERKKIRIADELYKISRMGMEATEIVLPKVGDDGLKEQVERQNAAYKSLAQRSEEILRQSGETPKEGRSAAKWMLRSSARLGTLLNKSSTHIAEMMINGSAMGIVNVTKTLNRSADEDGPSKELAGEYLAEEQRNIDSLKKHL